MASEILAALKKFFAPKEEVHKHWYSPLDFFQFSSAEFYQMIEKELSVRNVPGLVVSRVEFDEGGLLSGKREYLRLKRERLVFDICAAPFGTSYFFSFRFVELPLGIKPLELLVFLIGLILVFALLVKLLGTILGLLALLVILVVSIYVMRNAIALGKRFGRHSFENSSDWSHIRSRVSQGNLLPAGYEAHVFEHGEQHYRSFG
jgi:hypothetical protein